MPDIRLRDAVISDSTGVAGLVTQLGYPTVGAEMNARLERLLADPAQAMIVAEAAGEVVGLVSAQVGHALEFDGVYARITAMVVDTRWRGRGLGRSLMRQMEAWCRQRNAQSVILTSGHHRPDAHRFYQAIGYNATGLRFIKRL